MGAGLNESWLQLLQQQQHITHAAFKTWKLACAAHAPCQPTPMLLPHPPHIALFLNMHKQSCCLQARLLSHWPSGCVHAAQLSYLTIQKITYLSKYLTLLASSCSPHAPRGLLSAAPTKRGRSSAVVLMMGPAGAMRCCDRLLLPSATREAVLPLSGMAMERESAAVLVLAVDWSERPLLRWRNSRYAETAEQR
jgi:hypothetical protein